MKELMQQYGSAVISSLIFGTLLLILLHGNYGDNQGVMQVFGSIFGVATKDYYEEGATMEYKNYKKLNKPVLLTQIPTESFPGNPVYMDSYCKAQDTFGRDIPVILCEVKDEKRQQMEIKQERERYYFVPNHSGVYDVTVYVMDSWNQKTYGTIRIPIQQRGEN